MLTTALSPSPTIVQSQKAITLTASFNGSTLSTTASVAPIPTVTIVQADYLTDLQILKVAATTSFANSTLSFGTDPLSAPIGTMQFELGQFKGATSLATAPKYATVWNSNGGMATVLVNLKTSTAGGGTATGGGNAGGGGTATGGGVNTGGAGGGGSTSGATYKLTVSRNGKGTITQSPSAASYAAGTVVTLTAVPDTGSTWTGWTGACTGTSLTCSLTMNANLSVTGNFR